MTDARKIEAIAKALWQTHSSSDWPEGPGSGVYAVLKADYRRQARAVLAALKEVDTKVP